MANIPRLCGEFIYSTAGWQDDTAELVHQAIELGCRNFETGNHPDHYRQGLVGEGIRKAISENKIDRSEMFIQTKFIYPEIPELHSISNTTRLADDGFDKQIRATVDFALYDLRHSDRLDDRYLDSLLLDYKSIDDATLARVLRMWEILSSYVPNKIRALGVSNSKFQTPFYPWMYQMPNPSPAKFVRFQFDSEMVSLRERHDFERDACVFQMEGVLTENRALANGDMVADLAKAVHVGREVALYLYFMGLEGVCVVIRTQNPMRLKESVDGYAKWRKWVHDVANKGGNWDWYMARFRKYWDDAHPYGLQ